MRSCFWVVVFICCVVAQPMTAQPIACFDFENEQAPLVDVSGNGIAASAASATSPTWVAGEGFSGSACYRFDGIDDFIRVDLDINPWWSSLPNCSFGAFVKIEGLESNRIYTVISGDDAGFDRSITADVRAGTGTRWAAFRPNEGVTQATPPVVESQWTFVAVVYERDPGYVTFYVDGIVAHAGPAGWSASWPYVNIGRNPSFGEHFRGLIDNVFFFEGLLSASQIQAIHARADPAQAILATMADNSERERYERDGYLPDPDVDDILLHNAVTAMQNEISAPTWKFTMNEPGPTWVDPDFDDASWTSGVSGFGEFGFRFERYSIQTDWPFPIGQQITDIWLRREFTLEAEDLQSAYGAPIGLWGNWANFLDVYINGVPAFERLGALAVSGVHLVRPANDYRYLPMRPEAVAAMQPGNNSIAAHVEGSNGYRYFDLAVVRNPMDCPPIEDCLPVDGWYVNPALEDFVIAAREIAAATQNPAVSFAIIRDGRLVLNCAVGYADKSMTTPARRDDYYRLASLSKPPTAAALRKLIDHGFVDPVTQVALSLDTPVWDFYLARGLTAFSGQMADPNMANVTFRHLIHHEAGLSDIGHLPDIVVQTGVPGADVTSWDLIRRIYSLPVQFIPGTDCDYSNIGYFVQRDLIDRMTGGFLDYLNNEVSGWNRLGHPPFRYAEEYLGDRHDREVWYRTLEWPYERNVYLSRVHSLAATASGYAMFADRFSMPLGNQDPDVCAADIFDGPHCHDTCAKGGLMNGTSTFVEQQTFGGVRTTYVGLTNQDNLVGEIWFPGFVQRFDALIAESNPDDWESPAGPEDIDADWDFDEVDTQKFVAALLGDPQEWYHSIRSDLNGDDRLNGDDVAAFIEAVFD